MSIFYILSEKNSTFLVGGGVPLLMGDMFAKMSLFFKHYFLHVPRCGRREGFCIILWDNCRLS